MAENKFRQAEQIRYVILALQRQGNRQLNSIFGKLRLTTSQAEALEIVGSYGPMSTREVGEHLICESGSPSRLLATLADKGLTMSSQSTSDKRTTLHALTPKGRATLAEMTQLESLFYEDLSRTLAIACNNKPNNLISQLSSLIKDPELKLAINNRFPGTAENSAPSTEG